MKGHQALACYGSVKFYLRNSNSRSNLFRTPTPTIDGRPERNINLTPVCHALKLRNESGVMVATFQFTSKCIHCCLKSVSIKRPRLMAPVIYNDSLRLSKEIKFLRVYYSFCTLFFCKIFVDRLITRQQRSVRPR